jgi:hypothetical protein
MRNLLPMLAVVAFWVIAPAASWAQDEDFVAVPYDRMPITLPGWPPSPQPRQFRGMFGDRVLGQSVRPKTTASRFYAQGQRDTSGAFRGLGVQPRVPASVATSAYTPPAAPTFPVSLPVLAPQFMPEQPQPQTLPEQPLPEALRQQMQSAP